MDATLLIADDEAYREFVYDDATGKPLRRGDTIVGHPSIGYGLCVESGVGAGMSKKIALSALKEQIDRIEMYLDTKYARWFPGLDCVRRAAIVSGAYNMGIIHFAEFTHAIDALADGDWQTAAAQFRDSEWWRNKLTHPRAEQTAQMIESGQWPEGLK